jgi:hypothetical protein
MYDYRKMTPKQRSEAVEYRRRRHQPLHSPPHWDLDISDTYLITAACYEHSAIVGKHPERLSSCEENVLSAMQRLQYTTVRLVHAAKSLPPLD